MVVFENSKSMIDYSNNTGRSNKKHESLELANQWLTIYSTPFFALSRSRLLKSVIDR